MSETVEWDIEAERLKSSALNSKRKLASILAFFLGSFGLHKFYLGYKKEGYIILSFTITSYLICCFHWMGALFVWIPYAVGITEAILYWLRGDLQFIKLYQQGRKTWF